MHQESFSSVAEIVEIPLVDIVIDRGDFLYLHVLEGHWKGVSGAGRARPVRN